MDKNNVLISGVTFTVCPGTYIVMCAIDVTTRGKGVQTGAGRGTFTFEPIEGC